MVKELQRAIKHQQHIQVIYLGRDGKTTMRTLRPLEVTEERLKAYCLTRKAPRVFAIDNILAAEPVVSDHAV
ncbi:WYL domain-containing protein [Brevibacillus sp. NRS-1366]|uniref:WYL domain-containing protein n=1 Tax=Brevibacillus sp. NRS-1366 TaxID=3233899 RepID=UPI003D19FFF9